MYEKIFDELLCLFVFYVYNFTCVKIIYTTLVCY